MYAYTNPTELWANKNDSMLASIFEVQQMHKSDHCNKDFKLVSGELSQQFPVSVDRLLVVRCSSQKEKQLKKFTKATILVKNVF